jgi:hypothetical protein
MGGKYEIRFYCKFDEDLQRDYDTVYTSSWLEFMKLRLTKKVIYYKVYKC